MNIRAFVSIYEYPTARPTHSINRQGTNKNWAVGVVINIDLFKGSTLNVNRSTVALRASNTWQKNQMFGIHGSLQTAGWEQDSLTDEGFAE